MGNSKGVFLGPYLRFNQEIVTKTITEDGCPKCKKSIYSKFCESCGSPTGQFSRRLQTAKVWQMQLVEDLKIVDEFWCQEVGHSDVWFPNQKLPGIKRSFSLEDADDHCLDFLGIGLHAMATQEVSAFEKRYGKHFDKLRDAYGKPIVVQWGVVVWSEY